MMYGRDDFMPDLLVDETLALATPEQFIRLRDYSCSLPTGVEIGKRWRRRRNYNDESEGWVLGEYAETIPPDPEKVRIIWRDLEVVP